MPKGAFVRSIKALSFRAPPETLRALPGTLRALPGTLRTALFLSRTARNPPRTARNLSCAARDGSAIFFSLLRKPCPATAVGDIVAQQDLGRNCRPPEA